MMVAPTVYTCDVGEVFCSKYIKKYLMVEEPYQSENKDCYTVVILQ